MMAKSIETFADLFTRCLTMNMKRPIAAKTIFVFSIGRTAGTTGKMNRLVSTVLTIMANHLSISVSLVYNIFC